MPDGAPYYHACAPIANPNLQPDPTKANYDPRETIERAGHRDERVKPVPEFDKEGKPMPGASVPIAPGAGTDVLVVAEL
jgi:hypothetical protein